MSRSIHKYALCIQQSAQVLQMFVGAILTLQVQDEIPTIWVDADDSAEFQDRVFLFVGTGWEIPPDGAYIGTVQIAPFVWHLYERTAQEVRP